MFKQQHIASDLQRNRQLIPNYQSHYLNISDLVNPLINHRDIAAVIIVEDKLVVPGPVRNFWIPPLKEANAQQKALAN